MLKRIEYFVFFFATLPFFVATVRGQSTEDARKLYSEGKYAEALPVFEKLVKSSPKNASYNQWYGNCLLETGNPGQAEPFLQAAASKKVMEAYASLGKMYYLQYQFEASAQAYARYSEALSKEKRAAEAATADSLRQRSERAARMLSHCEDIQLIDSVTVDKNAFLDAYHFSNECGSLETDGSRIVYNNPLKNKRYFAEKTEGGPYRIYSEIKLQDQWSDRKELAFTSAPSAGDRYPFVLQDGLTLYFASAGGSSIGGYDLYVTRYNLNNDTYLAPNQLGMPFNSIANDYMLVLDEINRIGYFATDRFQPENQVVVYTFIPNEEILPLNTDQPGEWAARAKITSLRDTWKPGVDYAAYLAQVKDQVLKEKVKATRDFTFVINDRLIYYTLNDFRNDAAKQAFAKASELKREIDQLEEELDRLRREYAGPGKKQRSVILSKEERLDDLLARYGQLAVAARNLEIKFITRNS
ncbi:MAG: tetratricopeptide repeat protein [Dysgonamonadaceae bacterium]|jgi:hypothetical protein|nr:tetratricopeptide repeat protein [Dysgonamonadaceae bacterium]